MGGWCRSGLFRALSHDSPPGHGRPVHGPGRRRGMVDVGRDGVSGCRDPRNRAGSESTSDRRACSRGDCYLGCLSGRLVRARPGNRHVSRGEPSDCWRHAVERPAMSCQCLLTIGVSKCRPRRLSFWMIRAATLPTKDAMHQRDTRQRRAIRAVFLDVAGPLTPDEVLERAQALAPTLGLATVYRSVKILAEKGWLTEVELPGGGMRYELAARPHHHHFVCRACEKAFDIHRCPEAVEDLAPEGFEVDDHEVILFGRCPACT